MKKIISALLCVVVCLSFFMAVPAFAAGVPEVSIAGNTQKY